MGLKQRAARLKYQLNERLRIPPHAVVIADLLQSLRVDALLDVGANRGQFGLLMRRAGFRGRIVSFEPVSDAFARLQEASRQDGQWTIEQAAVGSAPGSQVIHVAGNSVSSSLLPMGDRHLELNAASAYTRDEEVTVTTVEAAIHDHGLDPTRTMLKADVQGFEAAVLDGAGALVPQLPMILLELSLVELYDGQPLMPELLDRLHASGQELWTFFPAYIDKVNGRLWWADGLFVRSDLAARFPHKGGAR